MGTGNLGGIYSINNTASGRRYFGSTGNLSKRMGHHRSMLRCGRHHNKVLQRDWLTDGEESFRFEIVSEFLNEKQEMHRWRLEREAIASVDPGMAYNLLDVFERKHDLSGEKLVPHVLKMNAAEWVAFNEFGGIEWLRKLIQRAKPPA